MGLCFKRDVLTLTLSSQEPAAKYKAPSEEREDWDLFQATQDTLKGAG